MSTRKAPVASLLDEDSIVDNEKLETRYDQWRALHAEIAARLEAVAERGRRAKSHKAGAR